jgi:hypothetical protein
VKLGVYAGARFLGVRVGSRYFKLRNVVRHPLLWSEREGGVYRRIWRLGSWEFGVRR